MTTGASSSNGESSPVRKKGWPKGRKRRLLPKDSNAPKGPMSGYMIFLNNQREIITKASDTKPNLLEVTKIAAAKWGQMDRNDKQKYMDTANEDKERYNKEMEAYVKTDTYKQYIEGNSIDSPRQNKKEKKHAAQSVHSEVSKKEIYNAFEVPIFTDEFISHNKEREAELRQLRKANTEYEEQNAILQKHIEAVRNAVEKLEGENKKTAGNNDALKQHLQSLRKTLSHALSSVSIPGSSEVPVSTNIDNYITKLYSTITANPSEHEKLINNVKTIINNLHL